MKPRQLMTERQVGVLTILQEDVPGFAAIRHLAIRFQNLLRHHNEAKLDQWLDDAKNCDIPAVVNFAGTLVIDIHAVRSAVIERRSNRQAESQINRLKTLKRAMFGCADAELLRARLLPVDEIADHPVSR
jgi:transposase